MAKVFSGIATLQQNYVEDIYPSAPVKKVWIFDRNLCYFPSNWDVDRYRTLDHAFISRFEWCSTIMPGAIGIINSPCWGTSAKTKQNTFINLVPKLVILECIHIIYLYHLIEGLSFVCVWTRGLGSNLGVALLLCENNWIQAYLLWNAFILISDIFAHSFCIQLALPQAAHLSN